METVKWLIGSVWAYLGGKPSSDQSQSVVVIGGGAIGLATAYQLKKTYGDKFSVCLLEAKSDTFKAASGTNTGCLHHEPPLELKELKPLADHSFGLFRDLGKDKDFAQDVGYRPCAFFAAKHGNGKNQEGLPPWMNVASDWDVSLDFWGPPEETATINPVKLGEWYTSQCRQMGVNIIVNAQATGASLSSSGEIAAIHYAQDDQEFKVACKHAVIAAGPWTAGVLEKLFPNNVLEPKPKPIVADWVVLENPQKVEEASKATFFLNDIVGHKLEYTGRNDGGIWSCGKTVDFDTPLPPVEEVPKVNETAVKDLLEYAQRFIARGDDKSQAIELAHAGRSFRPGTESGLPTLSAIPAGKLDPKFKNATVTSSTSGVFLCWGHSFWGVGLSLGSGKLMSQLVAGEAPDIDLAVFSVEATTQSNAFTLG